MNVKPFVKWAGGKSQLLLDIRRRYSKCIDGAVTRYCEPFVGGGAVLFDILSRYNPQDVLINDINSELINTYYVIKNNTHELILNLKSIEEDFFRHSFEDRKKFYYEKRDRFNFIKNKSGKSVNIEKSALFIFLNKTCFNGLFRVNKSGFFNVPMGSYKKPLICDVDNLKKIQLLLKNTTIKCGDYKDCLDFIDKDTLVYIDPPYRPLTKTANFTSYAELPFNDEEQIALGKFVHRLHAVGAKVIVSNSDPKNNNVEDDFFDELYKEYSIARVSAKRMINSKGASRGSISELLISNF